MSLPLCRFYSHNRNCKFGINCRYLHSSSQRPPPIDNYREQDGKLSNQADQPFSSLQTTFCESDFQGRSNESPVNPTNTDLLLTTQDCLPEDHSSRQRENATEIRTNESRKVCRYFTQHGRCAFGRNCRFEHSVSGPNLPPHQVLGTQSVRAVPPRFQRKNLTKDLVRTSFEVVSVDNERTNDDHHCQQADRNVDKDRQKTSRGGDSTSKLCKYFKSGYCSNGRHCRFSHNFPNLQRDENRNMLSQRNRTEKPKASGRRTFKPAALQQILKLADFEIDGTEKYRRFDIHYLRRRFQDWRSVKDIDVNEEDDFNIDVAFSPSDPDWPFDISSFDLLITLPKNYPKEIMNVKIPVDKQDLPESIRRYLEISIAEWLNERRAKLMRDDKVELVVRPFFKWLDRSLEELMTGALKQFKRELTAKAAGMEFIPADQLRARYSGVSESTEDSDGNFDNHELESNDESSDECLESDDESDSSEEDEGKPSLSLDAERKGTEIMLRNLQLKQNASSLLMEKLRLIVQCVRCKNHSEVSVIRGKVVSLICDKCNHDMLIQYRPTLAHQFTSIVGYLDLDNCMAFDLVLPECDVAVSCLSCSKVTKINGLVSGQLIDGWCNACNARFKFAMESVKFYYIEPSIVDTGNTGQVEVVRQKSKKPPKDPAIREGYPLPDLGTCKHYKQSYRWLRFPCCGKAYPCDVCHDKKEDHEMILANRMICGHCSKEQNYSGSSPCKSCSQHMTKVHSAHWEGGTGCRDKLTMSRSDQQKYRNMQKTISNHKKKVQQGSKKKNTKLRHT